MADENKLKPMPDASFKGMMWLYKLANLIWNPRRRLKKIPLKEGMVGVDYGCGPGRYTLPLAELVGPGGKVFAVDIQPLAIKTVKEKAARRSLTNIEPVLVDSYNTGIQGSSVDLVLLLDTLHMIKNHDALLHEIYRLLKPNGLLFMDPGHMKTSRARGIVESIGPFTIECRDKDMLVTLKPSNEAGNSAI